MELDDRCVFSSMPTSGYCGQRLDESSTRVNLGSNASVTPLDFSSRRLSSAPRSCVKPLDDVRVCPHLASSSSSGAFNVA